jgi:hypothetical protein
MKKLVFVLVVSMLFTMVVPVKPFAAETKKDAGDYEILINELVKVSLHRNGDKLSWLRWRLHERRLLRKAHCLNFLIP